MAKKKKKSSKSKAIPSILGEIPTQSYNPYPEVQTVTTQDFISDNVSAVYNTNSLFGAPATPVTATVTVPQGVKIINIEFVRGNTQVAPNNAYVEIIRNGAVIWTSPQFTSEDWEYIDFFNGTVTDEPTEIAVKLYDITAGADTHTISLRVLYISLPSQYVNKNKNPY